MWPLICFLFLVIMLFQTSHLLSFSFFYCYFNHRCNPLFMMLTKSLQNVFSTCVQLTFQVFDLFSLFTWTWLFSIMPGVITHNKKIQTQGITAKKKQNNNNTKTCVTPKNETSIKRCSCEELKKMLCLIQWTTYKKQTNKGLTNYIYLHKQYIANNKLMPT